MTYAHAAMWTASSAVFFVVGVALANSNPGFAGFLAALGLVTCLFSVIGWVMAWTLNLDRSEDDHWSLRWQRWP